MYVYKRITQPLGTPDYFSVGFFDPRARWWWESDHSTRDEAAARIHYLNGGSAYDPERRIP